MFAMATGYFERDFSRLLAFFLKSLKSHSVGSPLSMSTRTGHGLRLLTEHLKQVTGLATVPEGVFTARQRHLDALRRALVFVQQGRDLLDPPRPELLAEELRQAQTVLGEITGEFSSEDLLGEIFGSFCIGK